MIKNLSWVPLVLTVGLSLISLPTFSSSQHAHQGVLSSLLPQCQSADALPSVHCGRHPSSAFDNAGSLWVTWAQAGHVYVSVSKDMGQHFSPAITVNPRVEKIDARGESRPKIAVSDEGRVYVSYTQKLSKRFTGHVRFSYSEDGRHFSEPVTVNKHLAISGHRFDALALNRKGHVYIAWIDKRHRDAAREAKRDYRGAAIYYAVSKDGGKHFSEYKLADHSCECCRLAIINTDEDVPLLAWRHIFASNIRDHAIARLDGKSSQLSRISVDNWAIDACPHHGPSIAMSQNGTTHVVWYTGAKAKQGLLYAQRRSANEGFSEPKPFGNGKHAASHPYLQALGNRLFLVWREFDGKESVIRLITSSDNGLSWSHVQTVMRSKGSGDHPFLLRYENKVVLAWQSAEQGYQLNELD